MLLPAAMTGTACPRSVRSSRRPSPLLPRTNVPASAFVYHDAEHRSGRKIYLANANFQFRFRPFYLEFRIPERNHTTDLTAGQSREDLVFVRRGGWAG